MAVIYRVESSPNYRPIVEPFFDALAAGAFHAVTSVVTLMEIAVDPLRLDNPRLADAYEEYLLAYPNLTIVDVDRAITRRAAELRDAYRLRAADAIQVATTLIAGAQYFLTNDRALPRILGMQLLLIDSFIEATP